MDGKLTVEKARSVPLSRNPFRRHSQVLGIVSDPEHVGEEVDVVHNQNAFEADGNRTTISISSVSMFLGRRALVNVARTLKLIDENHFAPGSQLQNGYSEGPSTRTQLGEQEA